MFYPPNSSYALRTLRNVSASMQSYAHAQESQLQSLQLPSQLPQVRVSVRDNLLHLNRSCRRRRTRCPAHIHGHLHDLAHGSATLYHVIFWRYNKTKMVVRTEQQYNTDHASSVVLLLGQSSSSRIVSWVCTLHSSWSPSSASKESINLWPCESVWRGMCKLNITHSDVFYPCMRSFALNNNNNNRH